MTASDARLPVALRAAAVPLALLALWELGARLGLVAPLFFPPPSAILARLAAMAQGSLLPEHVAATGLRLLVGVGVGGGLGMLLGLAMGLSARVEGATGGLVAITHPLPKTALLPLFLVFFGYGETARLVLVGLAAAFPMIIAGRAAVRGMDPLLLDVCRSYGVTGGLFWRRMVLPACLPVLLAGLRLALNTAMIVTITVEMLASNDGLGTLLWLGWQTMRLEDIYAVLLLIGLFGLVTSKALSRWEQDVEPRAGRGDH